MRLDEVAKLTPLDRFVYWIRERHQIYLKKQLGLPKPWTNDLVLRRWWFTNPYRENDKVTVWFRENLRGPLAEDDEVVFATLCFRWFGLPSTAELLISGGNGVNLFLDWSCKEAIRRLEEASGKGVPLFTGAYVITAGGSSKPKIPRVCQDYIDPLWDAREEILDEIKRGLYERKLSLSDLHDYLGDFHGLGGTGFMGAQMVCDLKHTWVGRDCPDWWTWASPGPGSAKGLSYVLNEYVEVEDGRAFLEKLNILRDKVNSMLPSNMDELHAQDLQSCLCEFHKYERSRTTAITRGKKRRYNGG